MPSGIGILREMAIQKSIRPGVGVKRLQLGPMKRQVGILKEDTSEILILIVTILGSQCIARIIKTSLRLRDIGSSRLRSLIGQRLML